MSDTTEAAAESVTEAGEAMTETVAAVEDAGAGALGPQIAAADSADGIKVFRKCKACHTIDSGGAHRVGPNLYGVLGSAIAGAEGYSFSDALQGKGGEVWTYENMAAFLEKPKDWAPGTKMTFPGLKKPEDIAALLAYLREQHDSPPALPE